LRTNGKVGDFSSISPERHRLAVEFDQPLRQNERA
jgi:hypothetical protein